MRSLGVRTVGSPKPAVLERRAFLLSSEKLISFVVLVPERRGGGLERLPTTSLHLKILSSIVPKDLMISSFSQIS